LYSSGSCIPINWSFCINYWHYQDTDTERSV
jgi:hypothetical protein